MALQASLSTKRNARYKSILRQVGQSMTEYTVVMAALVGGLLVANNGACPDEHEDCIEYLLTVMHDNYDGYSSSISAVHEYATDYEVTDDGEGWGDGGDGGEEGGEGGGSGGGGETAAEGLTQSTNLVSNDGMTNYGSYDPSTGLVTQGDTVIGSYSSDTGEFELADGGTTTSVSIQNVVVDEEGNILERRAITDCGTGDVLGFGYQSEVDGQFYDSLQLNELDADGYCSEAAYQVVAKDGSEDGGRIVNGHYYAVSVTPQLTDGGTAPEGEVVYWDFGGGSGICAVMATGWDDVIEAEGEVDMDDPEEVYAAQLALLSEPDEEKNTQIGSQDAEHYVRQVFINGESASPNDCVSNRVISNPS